MDNQRADRLVSIEGFCWLLQERSVLVREVARNADGYYRPFIMRSETTTGVKKERTIDNPIGSLKRIQAKIKKHLFDPYSPLEVLTGGVRGRSVLQNAKPHVRKSEVVTIDIRDYFGSITNAQLAAAYTRCFGVGRNVRWLLTRLTSYAGHLPQGAPTSSFAANLVLEPAVQEMLAICRPLGLDLTVYVDDITLSGPEARRAIPKLAAVLSDHHLSLSRRKTAIMPGARAQIVTGVTVNRKPSIGRERKARLRREILSCEGTLAEVQRLRGSLAQACSISPSQGAHLQALLTKTLDRKFPRGDEQARPISAHDAPELPC